MDKKKIIIFSVAIILVIIGIWLIHKRRKKRGLIAAGMVGSNDSGGISDIIGSSTGSTTVSNSASSIPSSKRVALMSRQEQIDYLIAKGKGRMFSHTGVTTSYLSSFALALERGNPTFKIDGDEYSVINGRPVSYYS